MGAYRGWRGAWLDGLFLRILLACLLARTLVVLDIHASVVHPTGFPLFLISHTTSIPTPTIMPGQGKVLLAYSGGLGEFVRSEGEEEERRRSQGCKILLDRQTLGLLCYADPKGGWRFAFALVFSCTHTFLRLAYAYHHLPSAQKQTRRPFSPGSSTRAMTSLHSWRMSVRRR